MICEVLGYTRQAYYKHLILDDKRSSRNEKAIQTVRVIRRTQTDAGGRKLHIMLNEGRSIHQVKIGRDALFELLDKNSLLLKKKKKTHPTTNSRHDFQVYP
ncbi:MAG: putative transposase, partial [Candidatus Poribacteria bacterium]|nr:putative transposase [Candidatus Poribacteria bacterium]